MLSCFIGGLFSQPNVGVIPMNRSLFRAPAFVGVAATTLMLAGCGGSDDEASGASKIVRPVKTVVVGATGPSFRRTYPAIVLPSKQVELSFRVNGRITELPIRAAMEVKEGDVIAQLDLRDFKAEATRLESQLNQAKAQLAQMKAGARSEDAAVLQAGVDAAEAQVRAARQQIKRTRPLYRKRFVAKARLDQDQEVLDVALAQLKTAKLELQKGRAGARVEEVAAQEAVIKGFQTQVQSALDALSDATLRAPFAGIIAKRSVDNFANVQAKEAIATLQKLDTLDLTFAVPGPDVPKLAARKSTMSSVAVLDSLPGQSIEARFVEFSTEADPATQTYRARMTITPPKDAVILPGMAGQVVMTDAATGTAGLVVPLGAVASEPDGKTFVWVVSKPANKVSRRPVKIGAASGANVLVSDGVVAGDVLVTAGLGSLQENMIVRPITRIGE